MENKKGELEQAAGWHEIVTVSSGGWRRGEEMEQFKCKWLRYRAVSRVSDNTAETRRGAPSVTAPTLAYLQLGEGRVDQRGLGHPHLELLPLEHGRVVVHVPEADMHLLVARPRQGWLSDPAVFLFLLVVIRSYWSRYREWMAQFMECCFTAPPRNLNITLFQNNARPSPSTLLKLLADLWLTQLGRDKKSQSY